MRVRIASGFMALALVVGYFSVRAFKDGSTSWAIFALVFAVLLLLVGFSNLERYVMINESGLVVRGLRVGMVRVAKDVDFKDIRRIEVRRGATMLRLDGVVFIRIHADDGKLRLLYAVSRLVIAKSGDEAASLFDKLVDDLNLSIENHPS
jgi:hypothetical protein